MTFDKNDSPNPRIALLSQQVLFREGCSQRALDLGRVLSLKTTRPLEYYSSLICCTQTKLKQNCCLEVVVLYSLIVDSVTRCVL